MIEQIGMRIGRCEGVIGSEKCQQFGEVGLCEKGIGPIEVASRSGRLFWSSGSRYIWFGSGPSLRRDTCKTISTSIGLVLTVARLCIKEHNHHQKGGNTPVAVASGQVLQDSTAGKPGQSDALSCWQLLLWPPLQ